MYIDILMQALFSIAMRPELLELRESLIMSANGFLLAPVSEIRKFFYCLLSDEELRVKLQDYSARLERNRVQNYF